MKTCAYVAGDRNIIWPAIVCLASVKKYNNIDVILFTQIDYITDDQQEALNNHGITVYDVKTTDPNGIIDNFENMKRWPKYVFYNYTCPTFLLNLGYNFAIKLDYDIICKEKYDLSNILPDESEILTILPKREWKKYLCENDILKVNTELNMKDDYTSFNVGVFAINLKSYHDNDVLNLFCKMYDLCNNLELINETPEQFATALIQGCLQTSFRHLSPMYNYRPTEYSNVSKIYNIHYTTIYKPWIPLNIDYSKIKTNKLFQITKQFIYFNEWIQQANALNLNCFEYNRNLYTIHDIQKNLHYLQKSIKSTTTTN